MMLRKVRGNVFVNWLVRIILVKSKIFLAQIQSRWRVSGNVELTVGNVAIKYFSKADDPIVDILFYRYGYAEETDIRLFIEFAKTSRVVFDIGANTGLYSIAGATANSQAKLYSFEPHPKNFERLTKNIQLNSFANVLAFRSAVGDKNESVNFFIPETGEISDTSSLLKDFSESTYNNEIVWKPITVNQITLDDFIVINGINGVDLMKIDVEGFEQQVFEGAVVFFEKFKPVIICEIFLNEVKKLYFSQFMKKNGYTAYMILSEGLVRMDNELVQHSSGLNYLFSVVRSENVFVTIQDAKKLFAA